MSFLLCLKTWGILKDSVVQEKATVLEGYNHANCHAYENNRKVFHYVLVSHYEMTPYRFFKGLIGESP